MTEGPVGSGTQTAVVSERIPAPGVSRRGLVGLAVGAVAYALTVVMALLGVASVWLVGVLAVVVFELLVGRLAPFPAWFAGRIESGAGWRALIRDVTAVLLLVAVEAPARWVLLVGLAVLVLAVLRVATTAAGEVLRRQRRMPIVSRGLDLGGLSIPGVPPPALSRPGAPLVSLTDLPLLVATALAAMSTASGLVGGLGMDRVLGGTVVTAVLLAGAGLAAVLALVALAVLASRVLAMRRSVSRGRFDAAVRAALEEAAPRLALYFGGTPDALYQLEMWIGTLERLDVPTVVILRDRDCLRELGPTSLPVICVEHSGVLLELPLPHLAVALYPSHTSNNLHLLRRHGVRHVFVGHGDSDKTVSTNPFTKVYDENWVAGPAARERFEAAGTGLGEDRIVEIGRPQLDELVEQRPQQEGLQVTVLYTPTWEGYADEPHQSSVAGFGVELVRLLLADPELRLLYRPHPLLGTRDPAVRRAHEEIVRLLGPDAETVTELNDPADTTATAPDDLAVAAAPMPISRIERMAAQEVWSRKQLADRSRRGRHVVVRPGTFSLFTCFEAADALVSDVSSVVSDFLSTERPYAVTNPTAMSPEEFIVRYPASRGGYVIEPDGGGLTDLMAAARGDADPRAEARAALRSQLLGPATPPALQRMRAQVDRLLNS